MEGGVLDVDFGAHFWAGVRVGFEAGIVAEGEEAVYGIGEPEQLLSPQRLAGRRRLVLESG